MAKDKPWFPHEYFSRADRKFEELLPQYGSVLYGEYWIIVEELHKADDSRIELTDKFYRVRARSANMSVDNYKQMIDDCCTKEGPFILQEGYITIPRVLKNKTDRQDIVNKRREAGKKGGEANALRIEANALKNEAKEKQNEANRSTGQDRTGQDNSIVSSKEDIYISDELKKKYEKNEWFKWKCADTIIRSKEAFKDKIKPFVEKYGADLCNDFWYYWTQPQTNKSGKIAWELEKKFDIDARLRTFRNNNKSK